MTPLYFASAADWRRWLAAHHHRQDEVLVGFYKRATGKPSITWPESVDEALCFGWIDGIRRSIDAERYSIRFTPRRPHSNWSVINVRRVAALGKLGRMRPAGLRAFRSRTRRKTGVYSFEQKKTPSLSSAETRGFKATPGAWAFFRNQPPWYQRTATWWVVSAKREDTRSGRLSRLITDSAAGRTIGPLTRKPSA